jgi:shikimate dehydrogenase
MVGFHEAYKVELYGFPLGHSVSPEMHHAAAAALDFRLEYRPREVRPDQLAAGVSRLRSPEYLGANVTLPHKPAMLALVDTVTPGGQRIGAINTVFKRDGRLIGDNTDAPALLRCLFESLGYAPRDERALLLGAGGAARAAAAALLDSGIAELAIWNRGSERARELHASILGKDSYARGRVSVVSSPRLAETLDRATLVINATSVGLDGSSVPVDPEMFGTYTRVFDMVYGPTSTPLVRAVRSRGGTAVDGLWMLVYQAAAAFMHWTTLQPPERVMFDAASAALAARVRIAAIGTAGATES